MKVVIPFLLTFLSFVSSSPDLVCQEKCKSIDVEARCRKSNYTHKSNLKSCLKGGNTAKKLFCSNYCKGETNKVLNSHQECTNARISKTNIEDFSYCRLGFDKAKLLLQEEMKEITLEVPLVESEKENSILESESEPEPEPLHHDNEKTEEEEIPGLDDVILKVEEIIDQSDPVDESAGVITDESIEDNNNEVHEEVSNPIEASMETQVIDTNIIDTNEYSNFSSIEIDAVSFVNEKQFLE